MQNASIAYDEAIVAGKRKIVPLAVVDLIDPDIVYSSVQSNVETPYSNSVQIYNKKLKAEGPKYGTLEFNRITLDGSFNFLPEDPEDMTGEYGYILGTMCDHEGVFSEVPYVVLNVEGLGILQTASVHFTGLENDGYGTDFLFEIYSGEEVVFSEAVVGNTEIEVYFQGFTVYDVTAIKVSFTKWSCPYRFARVCEILPGIYEEWDEQIIYAIDVVQETAFDCTATPYGVCTLDIRNKNKRFNPFSKSSLFKSIEERQGIPISYGVKLPDGRVEALPLGVFYQKNGGWSTDAYGLTIRFKLVDIIGLITDRKFVAPNPLPVTLGGWIATLVAHLGEKFNDHYYVDPELVDMLLTVLDVEKIKDMNCGQLLRYACMAACAYFRADATTGNLKVETLPETGGVLIDLKNMHSYPQNKAGDNIAQITFRLSDENSTEYTVNGTLEASDKSLTISNPFIHTAEQADAVAAYILGFYNSTIFTVRGRGDMRSELGDVDTFETGFGGSASGRRYKQQLKIEKGIMKTAPSYLLAAGQIIETE